MTSSAEGLGAPRARFGQFCARKFRTSVRKASYSGVKERSIAPSSVPRSLALGQQLVVAREHPCGCALERRRRLGKHHGAVLTAGQRNRRLADGRYGLALVR